jgi:hypothetical protein
VDPSDIKPEHGAFAAIGSAVGALLARLLPRRRELPQGPTKRELEAERHIADLEEKLLDMRFKGLEDKVMAVIAAERVRIDNLQQQNGSQGQRLEIAEKDINNLWRRERGEEPE